MSNKPLQKEFGLSSLSVDNRVSVVILSIIITIFGIFSYNSMPKESFPEIVIPQIYVGTIYPGNSPTDMENLITRHIEKELKSLNGVKKITSTSIQDYSTIIIEFNPNIKIPKALQDVKDAVDKAKSNLPNDLDKDPNVFDINFSDMPILNINLSGNYSTAELKSYGEYLEEEIEKLSEVSKADVKGGQKREIRIDADIYKMEARQVSFNDIENAIKGENVAISGGNILEQEVRRSIRVDGEFRSVDDIKQVIVKNEAQKPVYLQDIAEVTDSYEERSSYARSSKLPVVSVDVVKRSGENLLDATDKIKEIIKKAQAKKFPKDLKITLTNDQSRNVRSMVSDLENSIISGVILVVAVLMFFMGLRSALMVGIAIPLSMFISFIILNAMGITLNIMVLFSLILALGMLVDNGIVVVENIYRLMEEGYTLEKAIKEGVGEIAVPIISSTATTVAAFLPLVFWQGIMGQFMRYLPLTLIIVLSSSLFVALVVNPAIAMLATKLDTGESRVTRKNILVGSGFVLVSIVFYLTKSFTIANLLMATGVFFLLHIFFLSPASYWFQTKGLTYIEKSYEKIVVYALSGKRPYFFFAATVALLFISNYLLSVAGIKVLFFPDNQPNYVNVFIQKPIGTDIEITNKLTKQLEDRLVVILKPYDFMVEAVIAQVGEGTTDPEEGPSQGVTPNRARITISFADFDQRRGVSTNKILEEIRDEVQKYPGALITVGKERNGPPVGPPINIELTGENYDKLITLADNIKKFIEEADIAGIEELKTDLETGKPELMVHVDRQKAQRFGLSSAQVALGIRTALFGREVSKFKDGKDDYPIQLRLKDDQRYSTDALLNQAVVFRDNKGQMKQVPISSVATIEYTSSFGSVKRKDLNRIIALYSNVKEGYNPTEVVTQIQNLLKNYEMPEGFDMKFTGEQEEQNKTAEFLGRALLLAIFMVFLIIVTQFNSLTAPLVIMSSVVFSIIGVFLGITIFQMDFVILMTGIGIISLAGVVVNNAIVLIDYTNLLRTRRKAELGIPQEYDLPNEEFLVCIAEAGGKRLRPVLLTAITTILGLVPLAVGLNINFITLLSEFNANIYFGGPNVSFWGPMAWTVIFGLTFATFLTLVIVPVMYLLTDRLKFKRRVYTKPQIKTQPTEDEKSKVLAA